MAQAVQRILATPALATSIVSIAFAAYSFFASMHIVQTSITRYSFLDKPLQRALSLAPAGLVRNRGILFLSDAMLAQVSRYVSPVDQGPMAFAWVFHFVLGAGQAYFNVAVKKHTWRPWPATAEVLSMSILALLWIRATFQATTQLKAKATANMLDKAEEPLSRTGSSASATASKLPTSPEAIAAQSRALPKPLAAVFLISSLLGSLGLGMVLAPAKFTDDIVDDSFYGGQPALASLLAGLAGEGRFSALMQLQGLHLQICREFMAQVGLQLLTEAVHLYVLARLLPGPAVVMRMLPACTIRAGVGAATFAINQLTPGLGPGARIRTTMSTGFTVLFVALFLWYRRDFQGAVGKIDGEADGEADREKKSA